LQRRRGKPPGFIPQAPAGLPLRHCNASGGHGSGLHMQDYNDMQDLQRSDGVATRSEC